MVNISRSVFKEEEGVHKFGRFWIDENGIYNFQYHPGAVIDLKAAQFISRERKKFFNGRQYPILVDGRGLKYISREASRHFSSVESTKLFTAGAILVDFFLSKMFGNLYLNVFPHNKPTRLFTNREEAIIWLLEFK